MKKTKSHHNTKHYILLGVASVLAIGGFIGTVINAQSLAHNNDQRNIKMSGMMDNPAPEGSFKPTEAPDGSQNFPDRTLPQQETTDKTLNYVLLAIFAVCFSLGICYLIFANINTNFYQNLPQLIAGIISTVVLAALSFAICLIVPAQSSSGRLEEASAPRDDTSFNNGNVASTNSIDLSTQTDDLTIKQAGSYTLSGSFSHSVVVDAEGAEVELVLDNVDISNPETAAIVGLAAKNITITTTKDSKNTLNDGGNSVYDGCIYSNAELIFQGEGELIVNGNQTEGEGIATETKNITFKSGTYRVASNDDGINAGGDGATITVDGGEFYINAGGDGIDSNKNAIINGGTIFVIGSDTGGDAGIDTDGGYTINGGIVVALGSDMVEAPLSTSAQKSLVFTLDAAISKDTTVSLLQDNKSILTFSAPKSFKTIVVSTPELSNATYQLSTGGTHSGKLVNGICQNGTYSGGILLSVNNATSFTASSTVSTFGSSNKRR